jgi:hypothetical protein
MNRRSCVRTDGRPRGQSYRDVAPPGGDAGCERANCPCCRIDFTDDGRMWGQSVGFCVGTYGGCPYAIYRATRRA